MSKRNRERRDQKKAQKEAEDAKFLRLQQSAPKGLIVRQLKPNKSLPKPDKMLSHADMFAKAGCALGDQLSDHITPDVIYVAEEDFLEPWIMNVALALEVLLKCLLCVEGKAPPAWHQLAELYAELEQTHKTEIEQLYERAVSNDQNLEASFSYLAQITGFRPSTKLSDVLAVCSDAFICARYSYELGICPFFCVDHFYHSVRQVIVKSRPAWKAGSEAPITRELPEKAWPESNLNPEVMLRHSQKFARAAILLASVMPEDFDYMVPSSVNWAFALEVLLTVSVLLSLSRRKSPCRVTTK